MDILHKWHFVKSKTQHPFAVRREAVARFSADLSDIEEITARLRREVGAYRWDEDGERLLSQAQNAIAADLRFDEMSRVGRSIERNPNVGDSLRASWDVTLKGPKGTLSVADGPMSATYGLRLNQVDRSSLRSY